MRLLLDTEAFISLSGEGQSPWSKSTRSLLEDDDVDLLLSAVSTTEIAIKVAVGKLEFCAEDIALGAKMLKVRQVNYEPRHAQRLFSMPVLRRSPRSFRSNAHRNSLGRRRADCVS